jgi:hypothetical protein
MGVVPAHWALLVHISHWPVNVPVARARRFAVRAAGAEGGRAAGAGVAHAEALGSAGGATAVVEALDAFAGRAAPVGRAHRLRSTTSIRACILATGAGVAHAEPLGSVLRAGRVVDALHALADRGARGCAHRGLRPAGSKARRCSRCRRCSRRSPWQGWRSSRCCRHTPRIRPAEMPLVAHAGSLHCKRGSCILATRAGIAHAEALRWILRAGRIVDALYALTGSRTR